MACSIVFTFFFHHLRSTFLCVGCSFRQHTFPSFTPAGLYLVALTSLVWFGIPSLLVIPAPTPSSCFGFGFGYGMLRFRPTYSKISQFFWIFWGIGEPPTKD